MVGGDNGAIFSKSISVICNNQPNLELKSKGSQMKCTTRGLY